MSLLKLRTGVASHIRGLSLLWRTLATKPTVEEPLPPTKPILGGPLPPKKSPSPYLLYCRERLRMQNNGPKSLPIIGKEWKEMSPQDKEKYNKESEKLLESYKNELEVFLQRFSSQEEVKEYFMRLKEYRKGLKEHCKEMKEYRKEMKSYKCAEKTKAKPGKVSALNAMKMDRAAKLPVDKRFQYVQKVATTEFKDLTPEELKKYQDMADKINQQRLKEYESKMKAN